MVQRRSFGVGVALKIFFSSFCLGASDPIGSFWGADCRAAGWLASWLWMEGGWHPWIGVPLAECERYVGFLTAWRWISKGEMRDMAGHESCHACLGYLVSCHGRLAGVLSILLFCTAAFFLYGLMAC